MFHPIPISELSIKRTASDPKNAMTFKWLFQDRGVMGNVKREAIAGIAI